MKKWIVGVLLIILCITLVYIAKEYWLRYNVWKATRSYLEQRYEGATFRVRWPKRPPFAIMGANTFTVFVQGKVDGRTTKFSVNFNRNHKIRSDNYVQRKFSEEVNDYLREKIKPLITDPTIYSQPISGHFSQIDYLRANYRAPLAEVADKIYTLTSSISWEGEEELTEEEFYNICREIARLIDEEEFRISSVFFRYSTDVRQISMNFRVEDDLKAAPEQVMNKISILYK